MKKILLLATGGTIACQPSADGLVPALTGESLVKMVPGRFGSCEITCKEVFNLDSSNLAPKHWQLLAHALDEAYFDYDGFVITHGTDTMAYTAAALHWMVQNLQKPVVLTGAQLPMSVAGSDAAANLQHAFAAACDQVPGVMLVFGNKIIGGPYAKKMYTESENAFASMNAEPWADIDQQGIHWRKEILSKVAAAQGQLHMGFKVLSNLEPKVAVIKLTPGLKPDILEYLLQQGYKGLVLESYGAGGVPNGEINWLPALEHVINRGLKVVCATQCEYEGVNLHKYPIGTLAARLGAKSAGLATIEASVTRLMWELGNR